MQGQVALSWWRREVVVVVVGGSGGGGRCRRRLGDGGKGTYQKLRSNYKGQSTMRR